MKISVGHAERESESVILEVIYGDCSGELHRQSVATEVRGHRDGISNGPQDNPILV